MQDAWYGFSFGLTFQGKTIVNFKFGSLYFSYGIFEARIRNTLSCIVLYIKVDRLLNTLHNFQVGLVADNTSNALWKLNSHAWMSWLCTVTKYKNELEVLNHNAWHSRNIYVFMYYDEIRLYSIKDLNINKLMDEMLVLKSSFKSNTQPLISVYFLTQYVWKSRPRYQK